jgi:nucleolar protein 56
MSSIDHLLYETEMGLILLKGGEVVFSHPFKGNEKRLEEIYELMGKKLKEMEIKSLKVSSKSTGEELAKFDIETEQITGSERSDLESNKIGLIVKAGLAANEEEVIKILRESALKTAEEAIIEESSRQDIHLVQAIQALDELDRFLNIIIERVVEWYSLHFPELQQILQDNITLCKLVLENGRRERFDDEGLKERGLSVKKIEAIIIARDRSKGGSISDGDLNKIIGLCQIVIALDSERAKLAEHVESLMRRIAPNVAAVIGSTIGARLIAKAGGMDRLARLPASTIQILGAEKALFRALRTGARPPKHGILFQHQAVHTAPKWQRGKIARTIANKAAIAARIDYYRGESNNKLPDELTKRIEEIKTRYKEPRREMMQKSRRDGEHLHHREKRKKRGRY